MVAATEPAARDPEAVVDHLNNAHVVVLFFCRLVQATSPMPRSLSCTLLNNAHVVVLFFCRLSCVVVSTSLRLEICVIKVPSRSHPCGL